MGYSHHFGKTQLIVLDSMNPGNYNKFKCSICKDTITGIKNLQNHKYEKHSF